MDEEKIKQLREKRAKLQKEVQLQRIRDRIGLELAYLESHNFDYEVFYDTSYLHWIHESLKVRKKDGYSGSHGDFQMDVQDSSALNIALKKEEAIFSHKSITAFFNRISNETKFIICSLGGDPELSVSKSAFLSNPSLFLSSPETWVLSGDKKTLIESVREQGVVRFMDISGPVPVLQVVCKWEVNCM